jgi:hypothetical protein
MKAREINGSSKIIGTYDYYSPHKETVYDGIQKYLHLFTIVASVARC